MRLAGKVAIVTGAGQGIGRAMIMKMAEEGAAAVVSGLDGEKIQKVVDEIRKNGGKAIGVRADVTRRTEVRNMVDVTIREFGQVDILVNNAIARRRSASFFEMTEEDWDVVLGTGLKGVFNCIQAVARSMMDRRYGKIINISSSAGMGGASGPNECNANYAAAKAGVNQLTRTFAKDLGPHGINVNCIAPGSIETEQSLTKRSREDAEKHGAYRASLAVLGRRGRTDDIANVALFLASDESSFITGQTILANGGRTDYML